MNEPVFYEPHWQVWTTDKTYKHMAMGPQAVWAWAAYGPRGSQSGVEATAEVAVSKAYSAAHVLDDPQRTKNVA